MEATAVFDKNVVASSEKTDEKMKKNSVEKKDCQTVKNGFSISQEWSCKQCKDCYTCEIYEALRPNEKSFRKRMEVYEFIRDIAEKYSMKTYLFGSVGLETFLPNGDVDIALTIEDMQNTSYYKVEEIFRGEAMQQQRFNLKILSFINAEVKVLKCQVDGIYVDITFNNHGGVETLSFLKRLTSEVFKRGDIFQQTLILLKAWCYYESHILGSAHSLMSTYCLTTMLIHIFNMYYMKLESPLEYILKFLKYYSEFDWAKGQHASSSIMTHSEGLLHHHQTQQPQPQPQQPQQDHGGFVHIMAGEGLKIETEILEECRKQVKDAPFLIRKYMNVIDPIRPKNNLGRSISYANYLRIVKAFRKGAKELSKIISNERQDFAIQSSFFRNTWNELLWEDSAETTNLLNNNNNIICLNHHHHHHHHYDQQQQQQQQKNMSVNNSNNNKESTNPDKYGIMQQQQLYYNKTQHHNYPPSRRQQQQRAEGSGGSSPPSSNNKNQSSSTTTAMLNIATIISNKNHVNQKIKNDSHLDDNGIQLLASDAKESKGNVMGINTSPRDVRKRTGNGGGDGGDVGRNSRLAAGILNSPSSLKINNNNNNNNNNQNNNQNNNNNNQNNRTKAKDFSTGMSSSLSNNADVAFFNTTPTTTTTITTTTITTAITTTAGDVNIIANNNNNNNNNNRNNSNSSSNSSNSSNNSSNNSSPQHPKNIVAIDYHSSMDDDGHSSKS